MFGGVLGRAIGAEPTMLSSSTGLVAELRYQISNPIAWSHTSIHNHPLPIPTFQAARDSCNTQLKHHIIASFDHDMHSFSLFDL